MRNTIIGSQTGLHCLLDEGIFEQSGSFFSKVGIYKDKKSRSGGWPMEGPNCLVYDNYLCEKLYEI